MHLTAQQAQHKYEHQQGLLSASSNTPWSEPLGMGNVRVKQPDDLLIFRGCRATRGVVKGVERGSRGVWIEVLVKRIGSNCSVV